MNLDLAGHLRRHKKSFTKVRGEIWQVLSQSEKPLSTKEIHSRVTRTCGADLATIYRNLGALKSAGLVKEVDLRENSRRWESVIPGRHVHHITCETCGRVEKLHHCSLGKMADTIESELGYILKDHYLEYFGICPNCQRTLTVDR
ncbi:MAG: Fur family transcriptional regulator [Pseudomonadota bacterium]